MADEAPIGLAELIHQVKHELLTSETDAEGLAPLFSVDLVKLELKVTVKKEGKAGIHIHVVEVGGGAARDDVQTVSVTLTPLLSKEERLRLYRNRYPERWEEVEDTAIRGVLKGGSEGPLDDMYQS
jgi:hypothetical protein